MKRLMLVLSIVLILVVSFAFNVEPAHAAVSGSLTQLTFLGATAQLCGMAQASGGTVSGDAGLSDVITLYDANGTVLGGTSEIFAGGSFSITNGRFSIPKPNLRVPPAKNPIRMVEVLGGVTVVDLSGDDPCLAPSAGVTWCNVGADGRANGQCWDRVAVYCNLTSIPPMIDIWGVGLDSNGFLLSSFVFADLAQAGLPGLSLDLRELGVISAMVDSQNNFYVAWNGQVTAPTPQGGTFYADGVPDHGFAKTFTCPFVR